MSFPFPFPFIFAQKEKQRKLKLYFPSFCYLADVAVVQSNISGRSPVEARPHASETGRGLSFLLLSSRRSRSAVKH
jgi:hypothetical protein